MPNEINSLQWKKMSWNTEMTDQNSLAQALLTKPDISNTLAYAFGDKFHLQYLTQGSGRVSTNYTLIGNGEFQWPLMGMLGKAIVITGAVSPAANIGLNFTPFTIPLAEKYFSLGDIVSFDRGAYHQIARVQTEPIQSGSDWLYTFVLNTDDTTETVPTADVTPGKELSFEWTEFEDFSTGGSSKEAYPMWFRNQMTTCRSSWAMSGGARTDVLVLQITGENGKKSFLWMPEKQKQYMMAWMKQTERMRWYGRYNRTSEGLVHLPGSNGRPVKSGDGVLRQLAASNKRSYSTANEDTFREFISDLLMNSSEAENKAFFAFTGKGGMDIFHKAMKDAVAASNIIDTHFVGRQGQNLTFGSDFITYKGLLNTTLTLVYNPIQDDPENNRLLHPASGLPRESYNFYFLDFSDYGGEPNISLIAKGADGINRSMVTWYTAGSTLPTGDSGTGNMLRSNSLDGFRYYMLSETAIKITNPLSCGSLIYTP